MTSTLTHRGFNAHCRLVADLPQDVSGELIKLAVPQTARSHAAAPSQAYFEVYRADRVTLTSILFSGGDWRWRFCAADGTVVAASEGYRTEHDCAAAVAALRGGAGTAEVRQN